MTDLDTWLKDFPKEAVESRIHELEAELLRWRNALAIHDSLMANGDQPQVVPAKPTKPQAIATIISEAGRPLKSGEIREQMVERGWLPKDPRATKRFYSTMTRLKGEGRIRHLPDGRYTLPEPKGDTLRFS